MSSPGGPPQQGGDFNDPLNLPLVFKAWMIAYVTQELQLARVTGYKPVFQTPGLTFTSGFGSPAGVLAAPVGSLFTRIDGGSGATLYCKETGGGTTSGWVAK